MSQEAQHATISPAELFKTAEAVARSGRRQSVRLRDKTLTISLEQSARTTVSTARRRRQNGFLAAYGSVPPLNPPRTVSEMTEIAAEEAAQEAARAGLPPYAGS